LNRRNLGCFTDSSKRAEADVQVLQVRNAQPADCSHPPVKPAVVTQMDLSLQSLRRYLNFLRWLILQPIDRLVYRPKVANRSGAILVVHPCRIGDTILWLDAARGLRELYPAPAHRIVLLADAVSAPLLRSQPYFDCVLDLDRERFPKSPVYRWQILRRIAGEGFSLALNPAAWQDYYIADSIMGASGADQRVGWSLRPDSRAPGDRLMGVWRARKYNRLLPMPAEHMGMLQLNSEFLHALGHPGFVARAPKLNLDRKVSAMADAPPYYVLCPGAIDPLRRWPSERFAAVAEGIFAATGAHGAICGSIAEKQLAIAISRLANAPLEDLTGSLSLEQFAQYAAGASLVISNDSGPLHVAAASGAPTLCILGGGMFGWSLPYDSPPQEGMSLPQAIWHPMECFGCNWRCVFKISPGDAAPCVVNVSAGEVTAAALAILASSKAAATP
jgi:ADP-heptose:LPS heptosyltransferase